MYDDDEVEKQNGAKMIEDLPENEMLQKRSNEILLESRDKAPPYYFGYSKMINEVVNQGECGNCFIHTFTTALELAYAKASGEKIKFSTQELTDCYNDGCDGGDYRMVRILFYMSTF
jgi:C1A family cysteine protease